MLRSGIVLVVLASVALGDERLAGRACRSVHLGYPAPEASAFYCEVTVEKSAPGTYFMVCGWNKGYFGIQELGNGKKLVLFSVWDAGDGDKEKLPEEKRVKLLHKDEKTRVGRFGNEGTGGQSFYDLDWKIGQTLRFLVTAKPDGARTEYAGYFFHPEQKKWVHMTTFSTPYGKELRGLYSFVEDFKRDKISLTKERRARFGNGWVKVGDEWKPLESARFTADRNPALNIDAGPIDDRFFLATGGEVKNANAKLNSTSKRLGETPKRPEDLPVK
jgi:hypothetical protein